MPKNKLKKIIDESLLEIKKHSRRLSEISEHCKHNRIECASCDFKDVHNKWCQAIERRMKATDEYYRN